MNLKIKKPRSEKHRRFIASLPCCVCKDDAVQCAHIRSNTGGGMGLKPGDNWCVPLCCSCHAEQGRIGERIFWRGRLNLAKHLALFLWKHTGDIDVGEAAIDKFIGI